MSNRTTHIKDGENTYSAELMVIESTFLGREDHGLMTASIVFKGDHTGVAVGGFALDSPRDADNIRLRRIGTAYGMDHIIEILDVVGVDQWEKLVGKQAYVLFEGEGGWGSRAIGIAHAIEDRVFVPAEHAKMWRENPPKEKQS